MTRIDKTLTPQCQRLTRTLHDARLGAERYVGNQGIGKQVKYASDSVKMVCVVLGSDELEKGKVAIKNLRLGVELSTEIGTVRKTWLEQEPAQFSVPEAELVNAVEHVAFISDRDGSENNIFVMELATGQITQVRTNPAPFGPRGLLTVKRSSACAPYPRQRLTRVRTGAQYRLWCAECLWAHASRKPSVLRRA